MSFVVETSKGDSVTGSSFRPAGAAPERELAGDEVDAGAWAKAPAESAATSSDTAVPRRTNGVCMG
jgi:hypothetical protein